MDLQHFRNPASQYRSAPFWSWNDALSDEELARQVRAFHRVGIGGFFMHSRVGLLTPYLSQEWMSRIKTCVREAERLGMKAWLYDEDSYPSGHAGGMVPSLGAATRAKSLHHEIVAQRPAMRAGTVAVYRCTLEGGRPVHAVRDDGRPAEPGEHFLHCYWALAPESPWYNDATYIDTLNPEAAEAFLRITHEAYAREVGEAFGATILGIFTDEPRLNGPWPWTPGFPAQFRLRKGYDIRDHLPSLLFRLGRQWARVRYDYWQVVAELFVEGFCQPVHQWCEDHGIALTGHYWEHTYPRPSAMGDFMAPYAYMGIPGIDCLGFAYEHREHPQFGYVPMAKEASSVAHQMGRPQVLSEAYGGSGWDLRFADQKWYWDWHLALGVNFLCQHLALYSLRGCRKRDFPPSFRDHQPWWDHYRVLGDYAARLGYALSQGRYPADVLVLHPCEGSWIEFDPQDPDWSEPRQRAARDALWDLTKALVELKCEFDLGSEWLLARQGRVRDGRLELGEGSYRTVILPRMVTIRGTTLDLLSQLAEQGGNVVTAGPTPAYLDGAPSRIARRFFKSDAALRCRPSRRALGRCLGRLAPPAVEVSDRQGRNIPAIYVHRRVLDDRQLIFLASMDRQKSHRAAIAVPDAGKTELFDAMTGEVHLLPSRRRGKQRVFELDFPPNGSHLVSVGRATEGRTPRPRPPRKPTRRVELRRAWTKRRQGPNVLVLDIARHRIGGGRWSEPLAVHEAQRRAAERFGVPWDPGNRGTQFWKAYQEMADPGPKARVKLRYKFSSHLSATAAQSLRLVVEEGHRFAARVNGEAVAFDGSWREPSWETAPIGHLVRGGVNRVELAIPFRQDVELEASFLIGDFQLTRDHALVDEKPRLRNGDWTRQGYPFYADAMTYEQAVELERTPRQAILCFDRIDAVVSRVLVNGLDAGLVFQQPLRVDVGDLLQRGENLLAVELYPSLRNLLGPLHLGKPPRSIVGPGHFFTDWSSDYHLVPYGIRGTVWLELADKK
ncbi:MAG: glycosyl hydrolase [Candidatus Brocadiia bacterium]